MYIAVFDGGNNTFTMQLKEGYYDDFALDFGWTVNSTATTGAWERGPATPTTNDSSPFEDELYDCGQQLYVTGNEGGHPDNGDIDDGYTILTSPSFDISNLNDPYVSYKKWFYNKYGPFQEDDSLLIYLTDGNSTVLIDSMTHANAHLGEWRDTSIRVLDHIGIGSPLNLIVYTADLPIYVNITEAAFDLFVITDGNPTSITEENPADPIEIYPNPAQNAFNFRSDQVLDVQIMDATGKLIKNQRYTEGTHQVNIDYLSGGLYLVRFITEDGHVRVQKLMVE